MEQIFFLFEKSGIRRKEMLGKNNKEWRIVLDTELSVLKLDGTCNEYKVLVDDFHIGFVKHIGIAKWTGMAISFGITVVDKTAQKAAIKLAYAVHEAKSDFIASDN